MDPSGGVAGAVRLGDGLEVVARWVAEVEPTTPVVGVVPLTQLPLWVGPVLYVGSLDPGVEAIAKKPHQAPPGRSKVLVKKDADWCLSRAATMV